MYRITIKLYKMDPAFRSLNDQPILLNSVLNLHVKMRKLYPDDVTLDGINKLFPPVDVMGEQTKILFSLYRITYIVQLCVSYMRNSVRLSKFSKYPRALCPIQEMISSIKFYTARQLFALKYLTDVPSRYLKCIVNLSHIHDETRLAVVVTQRQAGKTDGRKMVEVFKLLFAVPFSNASCLKTSYISITKDVAEKDRYEIIDALRVLSRQTMVENSIRIDKHIIINKLSGFTHILECYDLLDKKTTRGSTPDDVSMDEVCKAGSKFVPSFLPIMKQRDSRVCNGYTTPSTSYENKKIVDDMCNSKWQCKINMSLVCDRPLCNESAKNALLCRHCMYRLPPIGSVLDYVDIRRSNMSDMTAAIELKGYSALDHVNQIINVDMFTSMNNTDNMFKSVPDDHTCILLIIDPSGGNGASMYGVQIATMRSLKSVRSEKMYGGNTKMHDNIGIMYTGDINPNGKTSDTIVNEIVKIFEAYYYHYFNSALCHYSLFLLFETNQAGTMLNDITKFFINRIETRVYDRINKFGHIVTVPKGDINRRKRNYVTSDTINIKYKPVFQTTPVLKKIALELLKLDLSGRAFTLYRHRLAHTNTYKIEDCAYINADIKTAGIQCATMFQNSTTNNVISGKTSSSQDDRAFTFLFLSCVYHRFILKTSDLEFIQLNILFPY